MGSRQRSFVVDVCFSLKGVVWVCSHAKGKEPPEGETERALSLGLASVTVRSHKNRREGNPGSRSKDWTQKREKGNLMLADMRTGEAEAGLHLPPAPGN